MPKKDIIKTFIDEIYSTPPKEKLYKQINKFMIISMKSGVLMSLLWLTNRLQKTKDLDIYSLYWTLLVNNFSVYHLKINMVKLSQMN